MSTSVCREHDAEALVIGVGEPFRGDDGVGPLVAERVAAALGTGARVVTTSADAMEIIALWAGRRRVWVVDALRSGALPGSILRISGHALDGGVDETSTSSHGGGLGAALRLAGALDAFPECLVVFGVEGERFAPGCGLSAAVADAVPEAAARIVEEIRGISGEEGSCTSGP